MLGKLARLSFADWRGLGVAYLYLLLAGWRLFIRRERLDRWIIAGPTSAGQSSMTPEEREIEFHRARIVNRAANRPLIWARCLQRSLALCLWMERKGYQPGIRIGVVKENTELLAHAWVEYQGEVLNEDPSRLGEFTSLDNVSDNTSRNALPRIQANEDR